MILAAIYDPLLAFHFPKTLSFPDLHLMAINLAPDMPKSTLAVTFILTVVNISS